jgi:bifunctional UDP-N-acetylglucosamine pyrophosphorylase / glucosamine-1-phosphate N-acetyltransferase
MSNTSGTDRPIACVILAAGMGTRMKSDLPKVLHPVAHRPMVRHVLDVAAAAGADRTVVVIAPGQEAVAAAVAPATTVVQPVARGTGDAVRAARGALDGFAGDVLVLYADTPLLRPQTLAAMIRARRADTDPAVVVCGMRPADPKRYGRLVTGADGTLDRIVEFADADATVRAIGLCNAGIMAFDGRRMWDLLDAITDDNAKGEFYMTDAVGIARSRGWTCAVVEAPEDEVLGVDSRAVQAEAERIFQDRLRARAMAGGATLIDPATVHLAADTIIGRDVTIGPNVVVGPGVTIEDGVEILPFCHIEQATVRRGARIGPFARLRPGADVGQDAHVGNFVELKNTVLGPGAKANHLSYLGDATVGAKANIGAGTITCNYDGFDKHPTLIGAGAFVGSNTSLVAPVTLGDGAMTGAGTIVTRDVPADALALSRPEQVERPGWAKIFRDRKAAARAARAKPVPVR